MRFRTEQDRFNADGRGCWRQRARKTFWAGVCVFVTVMVATAGAFRLSSQTAPQEPSQDSSKPSALPDANRAPDTKAVATVHQPQVASKTVGGAGVQRRQEISDDSAKLLKMASDLKAEVDKTNKDTLSLGVIRKAEEIEKLAHSVRDKMKLSMASN